LQWQEIKLAYIAPLLDIPVQDAEEGALWEKWFLIPNIEVFNWLKKTKFACNKLYCS